MSLEAAIADLTKEVKRNNELLEKNIEGRNALAAKVEKTSKPEKAEKAEPAPAKKTESKDKAEKSSKSKEIDDKQLRKAFGEFMDVESEKVRDKRKAFVAALLNEFGADTVVEIEAEDRARALKLLEKKLAGEDVKFGEDDSDEDEAPKSKKTAAKGKSKKSDDDDDDDEDDDSSDDDDDEDDE